jgi:hypothetical protein
MDGSEKTIYRPPGVAAASTQEEKDIRALDAIQYMLRDPEWGSGMLEDIADLVRATGRKVEDIEDEDGEPVQTWDRH